MYSTTTTVFRIEDCNGVGPYQNKNVRMTQWATHDHNNSPATPHESLWAEWTRGATYRYGFISVQHLLHWFNIDELLTLNNLGFKVAIYECDSDRIVATAHQAVFDAHKANRLGKLNIEDMIDALTSP